MGFPFLDHSAKLSAYAVGLRAACLWILRVEPIQFLKWLTQKQAPASECMTAFGVIGVPW